MEPSHRPLILNLGCGTRTSAATANVDWSIYLRLYRSRIGRRLAGMWLKGYRREAFENLAGEIVVHDLRRGIPFADNVADGVYHSHMLEHFDRDAVPPFLAEVLRVLKPGGIHRIVVPNFGTDAQNYLASLEAGDPDHDERLVPLLALSVIREAHGTSLQAPFRRRVENLVLGDARRRGQTHQWAYDSLNLQQRLQASGFVDVVELDAYTSHLPDWNSAGLDLLSDGTPYKPGSLYMEARKRSST